MSEGGTPIMLLMNNTNVRKQFVKKMFSQLDENNDGGLQLDEVMPLAQGLCKQVGLEPPTTQKVTAVFNTCDADNSGWLRAAQFDDFFMKLLIKIHSGAGYDVEISTHSTAAPIQKGVEIFAVPPDKDWRFVYTGRVVANNADGSTTVLFKDRDLGTMVLPKGHPYTILTDGQGNFMDAKSLAAQELQRQSENKNKVWQEARQSEIEAERRADDEARERGRADGVAIIRRLSLSSTGGVNMFTSMDPGCAYVLDQNGIFAQVEGCGECILLRLFEQGSERALIEMVLTADGRVLAKKYFHIGYAGHAGRYDNFESHTWQMSEGTYQVVNPVTFSVKVVWASSASKRHCLTLGDVEATIGKWEAHRVSSVFWPFKAIPNLRGVIDVFKVQNFNRHNSRSSGYGNGGNRHDKGVFMAGATDALVQQLGMNPANAGFWKLGEVGQEPDWKLSLEAQLGMPPPAPSVRCPYG